MHSWVEFDVEKKTAKVIIPAVDGDIAVDMDNSYFCVSAGSCEYSVRIGAESELKGIVSASRGATLSYVTVLFKTLVIRGCDENWPSLPLQAPIKCRECDFDIVQPGLEAFIIPSLSWAFEDMRACEECQPFTPPCKSKRASFDNRLYISDTSIFCRGIAQSCPGCHAIIGEFVASASTLYHDLGIDGRWVEIFKSRVTSQELPFLNGYTPLSDAGKFVDQVVNDSRTMRMSLISDSGLQTEVKVLSEPLYIYPLDNTPPFRAIKCLVRVDKFSNVTDGQQDATHDVVLALINAANNPMLPKELEIPGNTWTLTFLPLPPELD